MIELDFVEFGKSIEVSQQFYERLSKSEAQTIIYSQLQYSFDTAKAMYFPEWTGSFITANDGPFPRKSIARVDGEPVSDDVIEEYIDWIFGNRLIFDFGDEYEEKTHYYYRFSWYAQVPKEFVIEKELK